ncbi:MAG: aminotransferase class V-fold PLP-dependent enzyme [Saprospiraceae bacterium]|nr:aminotransferase class V-fold PLP-dependent enzyme [Saprospiraceae bacterium]
MNYTKIKEQFYLDPEITFLNFGSFGACPKPIFKEYQRLQLLMEREPVHFITRLGMELWAQSRKALSEYINCNYDDVIYVTNPSYAVNIVAKSFPLKQGDEILATNIEYGACDKTWEYYCEKSGAKYVRQAIQFPLVSKEQFIADFFEGCNERTKLIFISHITSSTGLRLPVEEVCFEARKRGILCFVDGAHAPGQIPIDMLTLNPDFYTGACHKWMMTPKGSSFLYVNKAHQMQCEPLIVSWGYKALFPSASVFQDWHTVQGSRDYTAFLTIPQSIQFMKDNDWISVAARCRALVQSNAVRFLRLLNARPLCPISDDYLVQLYSTQIQTHEPEKFYMHLFNHYKIEVPVMRQDDKVFIRYSVQGFNDQNDLDRLYEALELEIKRGEYLKL